jgi:hypothetical protein
MKPKFKLGETVWTAGLTIRNSGTNRPVAYYIPLQVEIWKVQQELWWTDNLIHYKYGIRRSERNLKRTKHYHGRPVTNLSNTIDNVNNEKELSRRKSDILKECNETNRIVRGYTR